MTFVIEVVVEDSVHGGEFLQRARSSESVHRTLPSSERVGSSLIIAQRKDRVQSLLPEQLKAESEAAQKESGESLRKFLDCLTDYVEQQVRSSASAGDIADGG